MYKLEIESSCQWMFFSLSPAPAINIGEILRTDERRQSPTEAGRRPATSHIFTPPCPLASDPQVFSSCLSGFPLTARCSKVSAGVSALLVVFDLYTHVMCKGLLAFTEAPIAFPVPIE